MCVPADPSPLRPAGRPPRPRTPARLQHDAHVWLRLAHGGRAYTPANAVASSFLPELSSVQNAGRRGRRELGAPSPITELAGQEPAMPSVHRHVWSPTAVQCPFSLECRFTMPEIRTTHSSEHRNVPLGTSLGRGSLRQRVAEVIVNGGGQTSKPVTSVVGASSICEERRRPSDPGKRKHEPRHPPEPSDSVGLQDLTASWQESRRKCQTPWGRWQVTGLRWWAKDTVREEAWTARGIFADTFRGGGACLRGDACK